MNTFIKTFFHGTNAYRNRIEQQKKLYQELLAILAKNEDTDKIYRITDKKLLEKTFRLFGPVLVGKKAKFPLDTIYEAGIHRTTGSLIVNNKGATLFCLSPKTKTPYITHHIGMAVYTPGIGTEFVNAGIIGNIYDEKIIVRSESACAPSFLFNSQRCNCHHQWESIRELAAVYHPIKPADIVEGSAFERWVQQQVHRTNGRYHHHSEKPGFLLLHIDTQNGMGSGYTPNEFAFDLYTRASLRHRGEYSSEQIHQTSMAGGFTAIGLMPDPRGDDNQLGYKITPIVLDYLQCSKGIILLSNNKSKIRQLKAFGYDVTRVKSLGIVNVAGAMEARERGRDFGHMDISDESVSLDEELQRLQCELTEQHIWKEENL